MNLRQYLDKENVTVEEFAKTAGLTRMTIYNLINKKAPPRKTSVKLIGIATNGLVTLEDLIYTNSKRPKKLDSKQAKI